MHAILSNAMKMFGDNSPLILTSVGVAGVVGTAVLTGKATLNADRLIEAEMESIIYEAHDKGPQPTPFTLKDKVNLVWREYIPPILVGGATIAAIVMSHRIGGQRTAAMAAAFTMSERTLSEYKDKVVEKFGEKKAREVHDEVMQERVNNTHVPTSLNSIATGKVIFFDSWSGRYFETTMEDVKKAMNDLNYKVLNSFDNTASLTDFYNLLGLPPLQGSDEFGWNADKLLEIDITTCEFVNPYGARVPAFAIYYMVEPKRNYFRR